jgi:hypothetical protein
MGANDTGVRETDEGLWIAHPHFSGPGAWGGRNPQTFVAILGILLAAFGFGVYLIFSGYYDCGAGVMLGGLGLALLLSFAKQPYGIVITADGIRLEKRGVWRTETIDFPRHDWLGLWVDRTSETDAILWLYCPCTRSPNVPYAIPLVSGPWETVEQAADRISVNEGLEQVRNVSSWETVKQVADRVRGTQGLKWMMAVVAPGDTKMVASVRRLYPDARDVRTLGKLDVVLGNLDVPGARRQALHGLASRRCEGSEEYRHWGKTSTLLFEFGARRSPEAWLFPPGADRMTHQTATGERTEHTFAEATAVDVEAEVVGKRTSGDGEYGAPYYVYVYRVLLTLRSGERVQLRRCESQEPEKTRRSDARRDADWYATYIGLLLKIEH